MAASYSSFLSSPFYSPVFNTALFDGAFRIYFSQSYESTALKIYHLLQSEHAEIWSQYKVWSDQTKKNAFILIYPSQEDVKLAFKDSVKTPAFQEWEDGLVIGLENTYEVDSNELFDRLFAAAINHLQHFLNGSTQAQTKAYNDEAY